MDFLRPSSRCRLLGMQAEARLLTYPFEYWVGMDTDPRTTPEALAEFNRFYSTTHVGEVIAAHPRSVTASRYELLDPAPRGGAPAVPRWLAAHDDQAARPAEHDRTANA